MSLCNTFDTNELESKYGSILTEFATILPLKHYPPPPSPKALIDIITKLQNNYYGKRDEDIEQKEAKVALYEYCAECNIEQALLLILKIKKTYFRFWGVGR
eukprot:392734_1